MKFLEVQEVYDVMKNHLPTKITSINRMSLPLPKIHGNVISDGSGMCPVYPTGSESFIRLVFLDYYTNHTYIVRWDRWDYFPNDFRHRKIKNDKKRLFIKMLDDYEKVKEL